VFAINVSDGLARLNSFQDGDDLRLAEFALSHSASIARKPLLFNGPHSRDTYTCIEPPAKDKSFLHGLPLAMTKLLRSNQLQWNFLFRPLEKKDWILTQSNFRVAMLELLEQSVSRFWGNDNYCAPSRLDRCLLNLSLSTCITPLWWRSSYLNIVQKPISSRSVCAADRSRTS
jgi:hypothetical protein